MQISLANFNRDLENLNDFSKQHNLKLNPSKSYVIFFNTNKNTDNVVKKYFIPKIDNFPLPVSKEVKNLGIMFDENLTFQSHINSKLKVAYGRLKKLYGFKKFLPSRTKYLLCDSLILSLFNYGDVVYGNSLTSQISYQIQKVQNCCMRFSYNIPFRNHISPYLTNNNILNMSYRRKYHLYNFVYRIIKSREPSYLYSQFFVYPHGHNTRHVNYYRIPQHRSSNFQKSFIYVATHIWNSLPNHVKEFSSRQFSSYIRNMFLEQQRSDTF